MEIRSAKKLDQGKIAALIYSAGPELYDFLYKTNKHIAEEFIEFEFRSGRGFCGYQNVTVAVDNNIVVGTGSFYDGRQYGKLSIGTLMNILKFYSLTEILPILLRLKHIGSIMKKPKHDELYLSNFGVLPELRGKGIGRMIMQKSIEMSQPNGYQVFSLDVSEENPRAEKLYSSLGYVVTEFKYFSGRRPGFHVPNAKKMEKMNH